MPHTIPSITIEYNTPHYYTLLYITIHHITVQYKLIHPIQTNTTQHNTTNIASQHTPHKAVVCLLLGLLNTMPWHTCYMPGRWQVQERTEPTYLVFSPRAAQLLPLEQFPAALALQWGPGSLQRGGDARPAGRGDALAAVIGSALLLLQAGLLLLQNTLAAGLEQFVLKRREQTDRHRHRHKKTRSMLKKVS
jgi:hypothetical protein